MIFLHIQTMSTDAGYVKCLKQIIRLLNQSGKCTPPYEPTRRIKLKSVNLLLITQTDQESTQTYGSGGYCGGSHAMLLCPV